jgi:hypothetical protein
MYRNYTTSNIFDDDSFEIQPYGKDKYNDEDLDNKSTMFFSTMDSFYSQKKELEELDNETDYTINMIIKDQISLINLTKEEKKL